MRQSMVRLLWLVPVLTAACAPTRSSALHPATSSVPIGPSIESRIDAIFAHFGPMTPGCAVGVYRDGEIVFAKGYGMANLEHGIPITPGSVFEIASNTKQFTAFAIHMLARQGRLSLDDDVRKHVPEVPDLGGITTLRHMLHNTSGFRDVLNMAWIADPSRDNTFPHRRAPLMELLQRQQALSFPSGERFLYNNSNWLLLGVIIERVSGRPFHEFIHGEILAPLGMTRTYVRHDPQSLIEGRASSYLPMPEGGYRHSATWQMVYDFPGGGFMYSTIADLARWDANFFDERLGGPGIAEAMYARGVLKRSDTIPYASGLMVRTLAGERIVDHGGAGGGASQLLRFPERRLSVAVLCNQDSEHTPVDDYTRTIAGIFLGWPGPPAAPSTPQVVAEEPADPAMLARFAGRYAQTETGSYRHFLVHEGRFAERQPGQLYPMRTLGEGHFEDAQIVVEFAADARSGVLTVKHDGARIPLVREDPDPVREAEELAPYVGTYRSDEADVSWTIRVDDGVLMLRRRGAEDVALVRVHRERFSDPAGDLRLAFVQGEDGRAERLMVSVPRALNVEFRRVTDR